MSDVKFGTSGLRGKISDLTDTLCQAYARAFLHLMQKRDDLNKNSPLLIGYDLRPSSPQIATFVTKAARDLDITVENCGLLPTPALALAALSRQVPAIMVTGSHIPADRNGLKFYSPKGEIDKQDEQQILHHLDMSAPILDTDISLPSPSKKAIEAYKARISNILPSGALRGLTIGLYQHSCVGRDFLMQVLDSLGAKTIPFGHSDTFSALDTEALDEATINLAAHKAQEYQLDAIISTDGDGDRPLIAGSDGVYLRGDIVGLLTAQFLAADCVVTPVTSSSSVESCGWFKQIYRCRVGSPYVLAEMERARCQGFTRIVGFEANGGVLLGSHVEMSHGSILPALATRDALLPILAILGLAAGQKVSVQSLTKSLPSRFTASDRLENITQSAMTTFLDRLAVDRVVTQDFCQHFGSVTSKDQLDGVRLVLENGDIVHYRASGNAPELRCYSEASNLREAQNLVQEGLRFAQSHLSC